MPEAATKRRDLEEHLSGEGVRVIVSDRTDEAILLIKIGLIFLNLFVVLPAVCRKVRVSLWLQALQMYDGRADRGEAMEAFEMIIPSTQADSTCYSYSEAPFESRLLSTTSSDQSLPVPPPYLETFQKFSDEAMEEIQRRSNGSARPDYSLYTSSTTGWKVCCREWLR